MPIDIETVLVTSESKPEDTPIYPVYPVTPEIWAAKNKGDTNFTDGLAESQRFTGAAGQVLVVHSAYGKPNVAYVGISSLDNIWAFSKAAETLPYGTYAIDQKLPMVMGSDQLHKAAIGWALTRYKLKIKEENLTGGAKLLVPADQFKDIEREINNTWLGKNLDKISSDYLNKIELACAIIDLAGQFNQENGYSYLHFNKMAEGEFLKDFVEEIGHKTVSEQESYRLVKSNLGL